MKERQRYSFEGTKCFSGADIDHSLNFATDYCGIHRTFISNLCMSCPMYGSHRVFDEWKHSLCGKCNSLASPVVAYSTAGVVLLLVELPSAHAVILYWAPGTAGLIVTFLLLFIFLYCPIIGTPKRNTSCPVIVALVMSSFLLTWHTTAESVILATMRLGTLSGSDKERPETVIV